MLRYWGVEALCVIRILHVPNSAIRIPQFEISLALCVIRILRVPNSAIRIPQFEIPVAPIYLSVS